MRLCSISLRTLFRTIVVLHPLLVAAVIAYQLFATPRVSEDWRNILAWNGDGGWLGSDFGEHLSPVAATGLLILVIMLLVASLIIQVGLFYFRAWARAGFLVLTVALYFITPFLGLAIYLPVEALLYEMVSVLDGFIIATAYFSPLRREFARKRNANAEVRI